MRIGAATIDITPPVGTPLDGYGGRTDVSLGVHDPLYARALFLDDGTTRLAVVVCDLIGIGGFLAERARELIAERPGIAPENVMIAATHTHAGPAGVRGRGEPTLVEQTARKIAGAVGVAERRATEGHLKYGTAGLASIAQNRRHPDWPIDRRLDVLAGDTVEGRNIVTMARYSCHATVLERDNLEITADYPGEACRVMEGVINEGATAMFLNGCCANINPAWIRQDYRDVHRVGSVVGARAAAVSQELRPLGINHQAHNIRWEELTTKPVEAGRFVTGTLAAATQTFEAPYRSGPSAEEFERQLQSLEEAYAGAGDLAMEERRQLAAKVTAARVEQYALARTRGKGPTRTEQVQAFRLGDGLVLVGLPGEVFFETQEEIRAALPGDVIIAAYANDYPGYFCRKDALEQGGYEVGVTPFAPEADALLRDAAIEVARSV